MPFVVRRSAFDGDSAASATSSSNDARRTSNDSDPGRSSQWQRALPRIPLRGTSSTPSEREPFRVERCVDAVGADTRRRIPGTHRSNDGRRKPRRRVHRQVERHQIQVAELARVELFLRDVDQAHVDPLTPEPCRRRRESEGLAAHCSSSMPCSASETAPTIGRRGIAPGAARTDDRGWLGRPRPRGRRRGQPREPRPPVHRRWSVRARQRCRQRADRPPERCAGDPAGEPRRRMAGGRRQRDRSGRRRCGGHGW